MRQIQEDAPYLREPMYKLIVDIYVSSRVLCEGYDADNARGDYEPSASEKRTLARLRSNVAQAERDLRLPRKSRMLRPAVRILH